MCRSLVVLSRLVTRFAVLGLFAEAACSALWAWRKRRSACHKTAGTGHSVFLSDCFRYGKGHHGKAHPHQKHLEQVLYLRSPTTSADVWPFQWVKGSRLGL